MTHSNDLRVATSLPPARRIRSTLPIYIACFALLALGLTLWLRARATTASKPIADAAATHERKLPVVVTTLVPKDVPVMLEGLGSVTPLATVTVKAQVEGRLLSVGFQEGGEVRRGQLLAEIDARPFRIKLAQVRATLARDQALLHNAQLDLGRYETLRTKNLVAQQQLDAQRSQVDQQLAVLAMDQALADDAALQLEYTRITAPIDGVAGIRQVDAGNVLRANDTGGIVVLTQLDPFAVIFTLPQDELPRIAAALLEGPRSVVALNRAGDQVLAEGKLSVIDNRVDTSTGTVRFKAQLANPRRVLWPNQFVRARLAVSTYHNALTLPAAAVQHGPKGSFVYVVSSKNTAQMRPVTVAVLQDDVAVIGTGLHAGERVVVDGQDQLKPNAKLDPRTAASVR